MSERVRFIFTIILLCVYRNARTTVIEVLLLCTRSLGLEKSDNDKYYSEHAMAQPILTSSASEQSMHDKLLLLLKGRR